MEISQFPSEADLFQCYYHTPYPEFVTHSPPHSPSVNNYNNNNTTQIIDHQSSSINQTDIISVANNNNSSSSNTTDIITSLLDFENEDNEWQFQSSESTMENNSNSHSPPNITVPAVESDVSSDSMQPRKKRSRSGSNTIGQSSASAAGGAKAAHHRRLWVKDRSKDWWEKCNHLDFPEQEFHKSFRMSKATFNMICEELEPVITKKDTLLRTAIPVRQRVAVCLWRLATGEPLRLVSKRFGLGISTCHKLVIEVCAAIKTNLMAGFLKWPNAAKISAIKDEFKAISGIPNVAGCIYTTHIPIIAPKINVGAYFNKNHTERNQKTSYSITVQGVVDPNGVLIDVCIGWPGSMPDDKVLEQSALLKRANRGMLNNIWIAGNSGYPLMDWVLVPYSNQNLTWAQHSFNEKIQVLQKVAKDAFSRLKKRWGCLQKRTEVKLQELPVVLGACCVLHNICEIKNEAMDPEIDNSFELFDDEILPENPIRSGNALKTRDHIAHDLLHRGIGGTSFL